MRRLRGALGPMVAAWLLCQAGMLVVATATFGFEAMAVQAIECTCAHGAGHSACPMHRAPAPSGTCLLQYSDADSGTLGPLLGQAGLEPAATRAIRYDSSRADVPIDVTAPNLRPAPPDPPPPRA